MEQEIDKILKELDFIKVDNISYRKGLIKIITDYEISLSIRVYPCFVYTISLANEQNIPKNEIIDWLDIAEQIEDNIIYYKK